MALIELFGNTLLTSDGEKPTTDALAGKTAIGIYFSAHWCPPCRGFTPHLAKMYKDAFEAKGMAIVFVSSDQDQAAFNEYFVEMPWFACPYPARDKKDALSSKFKVRGIPSLVIIDPEGKTITEDGRSAVMKDPQGERYPWTPPTQKEKAQMVLNAIGSDLLHQSSGKPIGLYFSAHWCPPCRGFTPKLAGYYNEGLKDKMEIIFVSSDRDEASFKEYHGTMPWPALPYDKKEENGVLSELMGVQGIPTFAVIHPDGRIITTNGRSKVEQDPKGEKFPAAWLPQPFDNVNADIDPSDFAENKSLIAFGSDTLMVAALKAVAAEQYEAAGQDVGAMPMRFFEAPDTKGNDDMTKRLRAFIKVRGDKLVLTDLAAGKFYVCDEVVSDAAAVNAFLAQVESGQVRQQSLEAPKRKSCCVVL